MATEKALEDNLDIDSLDSQELDQAIDGLRGVLKQDAAASLNTGDESVDTMGGAAAFSSDFGADFPETGAGGGLNDPFNIGDSDDSPLGGSDFGMGSDFGGAAAGGAAMGSRFDLTAMDDAEPGPRVGATGNTRVDMVLDIPIDVQIILGTSRMVVSSLMELSEGSTIALDRKIGEPVEIILPLTMIRRRRSSPACSAAGR